MASKTSSREDIVRSLAALKAKYPACAEAVVKMNDGFSGDGSALYRYADASGADLEKTIAADLDQLSKPVAAELKVEVFLEKLAEMGGIVEEFLEGENALPPVCA